MAGTFRTSFDFLDVIGFREGFTPDRPYQSWATESVYVVRDEPRFASLQHVLVMFVLDPKGGVQGPLVTKHWRQDWRYEDPELLTYRGHQTWARTTLRPEDVRGTWSQAVDQVDDSPRYEAVGRWRHFGNVSSWESDTTWRPLPRPEFSVRDDYHVLIGTNRHTITPTGWVQEEENLKVVLDDRGRRYQERTEPFWAEVRAAWADVAARHERFTLRAAPDRGQLFTPLFEYAERLYEGAPLDAADARSFARRTVASYLTTERGTSGGGY